MAKKRRISAYNRHVGRERKAGKTMKQAAASWKRGGSSPKRKKTMPKKKSGGGRKGSRIIGNLGFKGLLTGGILLLASDRLVPPIGGAYASPIKEIAAGAAGKAIGVGGATLMASGAIKAVAITLSRVLSGGLGAIGGGGGGTNGGYDY